MWSGVTFLNTSTYGASQQEIVRDLNVSCELFIHYIMFNI